MSIHKWLQQTAELGYSSITGGFQAAGSSVGYLSDLVGNFKLFGNNASGDSDQAFDERHYFLVPDMRNPDGYSIVVTRLLPEGIPPINALPKRRLLHLPNLESELMLRELLVNQAKREELSKTPEGKTLATRAREMADAIDALDDRVFGGVLLIGGLVAIFNPVAGAAIAAKSLLPSLAMFASKYGLLVAEEKLTESDMQRRVKEAEKEVAKEFHESGTEVIANELLNILQKALNTEEDEYDPMLAFDALRQVDKDDEAQRLQTLAARTIVGVYADAMDDRSQQHLAQLGPEDLRFLQLLKTVVDA